MKINFGCGFNKKSGYLNVDKFDTCSPDLLADLDVFPWPLDSDSVDESFFNHSLEHMAASADGFIQLMQELYRVSKHQAIIQIHVPHPRHDNFIGDPTHVRIITPQVLTLFSKKLNLHWQKVGAANSPLALYAGVDFEIKNVNQILENKFMEMLQKGEISEEELRTLANERNNVISEYQITLQVIK